MRTRRRRGCLTAGAGAATLSLLAATTTAARAAPAAGPVDVRARQAFVNASAAPGGTIGVRPTAELLTGQAPRWGLTLTLPQGVAYVRTYEDGTDGDCAPSADGRIVKCTAKDGKADVAAYVLVEVDADVAPGTTLTFTTTADTGDTVDAQPGNDTVTGKVAVRTPADLGFAWEAPSGPVAVGEGVTTRLVVTNHGPAPVRLDAVHFSMGTDYGTESGYEKDCWAEPDVLICDVLEDLAPGATVTIPFAWNFPKEAAGTTHRVQASLPTPTPNDPDRSNDEATLVLTVAKASSTTSTTGGWLAEVGAGPVMAAAAGATALTLTGGALVLLRNRSRRTG
ncbi:hypothetical protein [Streptomyces sp. NPDC002328]|uniref:hypothetical protein n=1 Tax=Streptomyces sp. NPDC002328 TaxID=3364642 RepID=UPI0036C4FAC5